MIAKSSCLSVDCIVLMKDARKMCDSGDFWLEVRSCWFAIHLRFVVLCYHSD